METAVRRQTDSLKYTVLIQTNRQTIRFPTFPVLRWVKTEMDGWINTDKRGLNIIYMLPVPPGLELTLS